MIVGVNVRFEFDQEVGATALRVEIRAAGSGTENLQPPDVEPAAEFGERLAFAADGGVHGWLPSCGR